MNLDELQMSDIPQDILEKPEVPEDCKDTNAYFVDQGLVCMQELEEQPDLLNAGYTRKKRWGLLFCARPVPELDKLPSGPLIFPPTTMQFIDADTLEELKARALHELEVSIDSSVKLLEHIKKQTDQLREDTLNSVCEEVAPGLVRKPDDSETATVTE